MLIVDSLIGAVLQTVPFSAIPLIWWVIWGRLVFSLTGWLGVAVIVLFTGCVGWLMGYINEKQTNGSIGSSWLIHGSANTLAAVIAMFSLT